MIIIPRKGSNWIDAGTITIGAVTTGPTKGTVTRDKVFWRYDGQDALIHYQYYHAAGGAAGSGDYLISIPAAVGLVDTNIIAAHTGSINTQQNIAVASKIFGEASSGVAGTNQGYGQCYLYSTTQFRILWGLYGAASAGVWGSAYNQLSGANFGFGITIRVPIAGRSS